MLRLSLATRITLIVLVMLLVAWIGALALYYRSQAGAGENARPLPHQIAALVELAEQTPPDQRPLFYEAVSSSILNVRSADTANLPSPEARPVVAALHDSYAAALGDRAFVITTRPVTGSSGLATRGLEFRVVLKDGETLVLDTKSPLPLTVFGLPVGFGAGLIGTLIALAALIVMHRETRPLARLSAAVDRMDLAGEPSLLPQARTSAPEIQTLIAAFNRLQERLSRLLRARMAMLGGISHDVRTFATRLRLRVDHIPEGTERERAIGDIDDIVRLLDDALLSSRAGAGELSEELVDFGRIVEAEVEDRKAAGAPVDLRMGAPAADAAILGDRLALRRIVSNLIDNAVKYGQAAHLSLETDPEAVLLTIDDEGPGIPAELREELFEPFVRLETSRNRRTGGAGLGLAIVRNLVEAQGGSVATGDAPAGGARFTVRLPLFRHRESPDDGAAMPPDSRS
ncbi:two-component sensor histidine kinase [Hypericibacter terrae]|uniref:histidine kinase n=1 Tax=Hypericibacter terrae TaxID=2602015 RepID=A0A5J6MKP7_9PROT|nr:ATP-binding protein [Hypericibacter terrae]QEX16860.1 two-component sensor histidine kinase [Hypericibacter terrae]